MRYRMYVQIMCRRFPAVGMFGIVATRYHRSPVGFGAVTVGIYLTGGYRQYWSIIIANKTDSL